ncbi:T9SS type A sorting domain-containing protein [Candidatus Poribacteria bacterium]|nr:T9SS type A sorting domain-containing protein [Candidatus Poribacteria bacterium]
MAADAPVSIYIYNVKGQLVRQLNIGKQEAGSYVTKDKAIHWDGKNERGENVASGNYWYRLRAGEFNATRRMVILK